MDEFRRASFNARRMSEGADSEPVLLQIYWNPNSKGPRGKKGSRRVGVVKAKEKGKPSLRFPITRRILLESCSTVFERKAQKIQAYLDEGRKVRNRKREERRKKEDSHFRNNQ